MIARVRVEAETEECGRVLGANDVAVEERSAIVGKTVHAEDGAVGAEDAKNGGEDVLARVWKNERLGEESCGRSRE